MERRDVNAQKQHRAVGRRFEMKETEGRDGMRKIFGKATPH
jgi:hypothetical protein